MPYDLVSPFQPAGDQPRAIRELAAGLARGDRYQTLLGVTGSGKTMTIANVVAQFGRPTLVLSHNKTLAAQLNSGKTMTIANVVAQFGRPTLVLSHNKTLAAQLYGEFKSLFPRNAV